jgi:hypothetical protein
VTVFDAVLNAIRFAAGIGAYLILWGIAVIGLLLGVLWVIEVCSDLLSSWRFDRHCEGLTDQQLMGQDG